MNHFDMREFSAYLIFVYLGSCTIKRKYFVFGLVQGRRGEGTHKYCGFLRPFFQLPLCSNNKYYYTIFKSVFIPSLPHLHTNTLVTPDTTYRQSDSE